MNFLLQQKSKTNPSNTIKKGENVIVQRDDYRGSGEVL